MSSSWHSAKFDFFLKKFFAECPLAGAQQSLNFFFKKNSLPSALWPALGKVWFFLNSLPSGMVMALDNGVLCRVQHSAKWPKTAIFNFFYIPSWQINSYKHISHIYLIHHIYISSIRTYHIITIYITYIIISAQVHPNKSTSPSKPTSISQVHHQVNNKWKKYNVHSLWLAIQ